MKKHSLYNRILSGILSIVTLISLIPMQAFSEGPELPAAEESVQVGMPETRFQITVDGEEKESLTLRSFEKIEISADGLMESAQYQWQILHPEKPDVWVSIYGATDTTLPVTLALVKNMLDGSNTTQLRCRAIVGDVPQYTPALTVAYDETAVYTPVVEAEPVPETTPEEVTEPTEATEATEPIESTEATETIEPTEVPETIAPTETIEVTEPTEVIETTEPVVPETIEVTEPAAVTEPTETAVATEPTEVTEPTEPAETQPATEAVEPVEMTEPAEETTPVEVTEPAAVSETTAETEPALIEETVPAETAETTTAAGETTPAEAETEETSQPAGKPEYSVAPETATLPGMTLFSAPARAAEDDEFVTVTIEYIRYDYKRDEYGALVKDENNNPILDDAGSVAFNSYIATLQKGTDLTTTVPVPTMVGYDAFLDDAKVTQVDINLNSIQAPVTYTVKYKPAQVSYTVRYYFQNVYDDLYVENTDEKVTDMGATGSTPPEDVLNKKFQGFLSLYYQPDSIAADGSTVFEVYYERNYYLMEFDCNGGYGTDTLYIRYGTYISVPNPVRSGYLFGGWDLTETEDPDNSTILNDGNANELPETMPPYNMAYKAIWNQSSTKYTIVYWAENANDGYYSYWGTASTDARSAVVLVPAEVAQLPINAAEAKGLQDYEHFYLDVEKTAAENPAIVRVEGDGSTVINVYYKRNMYTLDFVWTGKCLFEHTHTDVCYEYYCAAHTHVASCYVCNRIEHYHTSECCSLYHVHGATCAGGCTHVHELSCYTTSNNIQQATNNNTGFTTVKNAAGSDPQEGIIYRYKTNSYNSQSSNYHNYIFIGSTWYYLGTGNGNTVQGFSWSGSNPVRNAVATSQTVNDPDRCTHSHTTACYDCGQEEHTHMADETCDHNACSEGGTEHTHTASCYHCGQEENGHVHTGECYLCGTHPHSEHSPACNAHLTCLLTEHAHGNTCNSANRKNLIYSITAKYDADISGIWAKDPIKSYLEDGIVWQSSITGKYYSFLEKMPTSDMTLTHTGWSGQTYTWYYYLEVSPYEDTTGLTLRTDGGVQYKLYHQTSVNGSNISLTYEEDYFPITGYSQRDNNVPSFNNRTAYLYYRINQHSLKFYNRSDESPTPTDQTQIYYNQSLKTFEVSKEEMQTDFYPAGIEPGAYQFGGWYTTPECYDGTEVDWDNATMPDSDMEIYAKWTPIKRNVTFYTLFDDISKKEGDEGYDATLMPFQKAEGVPHGEILGSTYNKIPSKEDDPRIDGYTFIGWFYMDEDNKKRFAPDSMEITRDLVLFAEWTTQIDTTYEIQYVLRDEYTDNNSSMTYPKGTPVAESIFAHSSVGKTKTFTAKGTTELLPAFQTGFFPTTNSHSILMDKDSINNTYTFEYVYDDAVWYKVRYLEVSTNKELHAEKKISTQQAVVTEKFLPIPGYIPQNYYIRKTLAYDENATEPIEENVITFYYVQDTEHGLYSVEYYLENVDSQDETNRKNYTQYESIVGSADIDNEINADLREYEGYTRVTTLDTVTTYDKDGNETTESGNSGKVTQNGLTIKLYYKRNSYPYIIEYREYGTADTAEPLWSQGSEAKFGTEIEYSLVAEDRNHRIYITENGNTYEYYISNATPEQYTKSMTIRAFNDGEDNPNKLIFYFVQKKVEVFYHAVCTDQAATDFGVVSLNSETASAATNLAGSTATAKTGFKFKGWYKDKEGTEPVDVGWLAGNHLTPKELNQDEDWENHYYALFEPVRKDLKIVKNGTGIDSGDSFIFTITGKNVLDQDISMTVSIQGEGNVTIRDLYCGDYTVTETDWAWEYSCTGVSLDDASQPAGNVCQVSLTNGSEETTTVTFTNKPKNVDWLHGESCNENVFKAFQPTT